VFNHFIILIYICIGTISQVIYLSSLIERLLEVAPSHNVVAYTVFVDDEQQLTRKRSLINNVLVHESKRDYKLKKQILLHMYQLENVQK
jgi:hypothetical protein